MGLDIRLLTDGADRISFPKVPLVGRHVLDATVAMLAVVPLHKAFNPTAHGIQVAKPTQWVAPGCPTHLSREIHATASCGV